MTKWNNPKIICDFLCVCASLLGGTGQRQSGKFLQKRLPNSVPFPCKTRGFRSRTVPDSVHQLRPGFENREKNAINFILNLSTTSE